MATDQAVVLRRVEQLTAAEGWRTDRRTAWVAILRGLVHGMSWTTGLVTGVTAARLAAASGRSERTVSNVLRWAKDVGLLVTVEEGAAASFLGSKLNRAPTYVFLAAPKAATNDGDTPPEQERNTLCDLPQSYVGIKPLPGGRRLEKPALLNWPLWRIPETPSQRSAAIRSLSRRIGLDRPGVPQWRIRPALKRWFDAGWCVAGLLHALDHHPDQPHQHRGDALRGAHDPIRLLIHRLKPWEGRLAELPTHLHGLRGDYQLEQARQLHARLAEPDHTQPTTPAQPVPAEGARQRPASSPAHRTHLRAQFVAHQRRKRATRT